MAQIYGFAVKTPQNGGLQMVLGAVPRSGASERGWFGGVLRCTEVIWAVIIGVVSCSLGMK